MLRKDQLGNAWKVLFERNLRLYLNSFVADNQDGRRPP
jgi:hypothetical protein